MKVTVKDAAKGLVQIDDIRLGFRCLWDENIYEGKPTGRQVASFLISEQEVPEFKKVIDLAASVYKSVYPQAKNINDNQRNPRFIQNEDGSLTLKTSNAAKFPARYYDNRGREVSNPRLEGVENSVLYAGCRVNVKIQFNCNNKSTALWSNLVAIQFAGDDEPIGGLSSAEVADGFGAVDTGLGDDTPSQTQNDAPSGSGDVTEGGFDDLFA